MPQKQCRWVLQMSLIWQTPLPCCAPQGVDMQALTGRAPESCREALRALLDATVDPSSREDLVSILKTALVAAIACVMGCNKVSVGDR